MSLRPLEGEYAKPIPLPAIAKGTLFPIQKFLVEGTGYPYYAWLPPRGTALLMNHPRHPPGDPVYNVTKAPPKKVPASKQQDEEILTSIINGKVPYNEALKCTSQGFFDKNSNKERVRVRDGRHWRLHKGTYFVQFDWKTQSPAAGAPRYTKEQMYRVLRDLIFGGGRVLVAMHKLQENGFISGDEDYFWTADGQAFDWINEKWVLREAEAPTSEDITNSEIDPGNLERLEKKYPKRDNVRRMRTWAGPRHVDVAHDGEERLPAHPTSSRFGNRGMKRKHDDVDGIGQVGNDGHAPVTGGNTKPQPKKKAKKPPPTKQKEKPAVAVPPRTMTTRGQTSKKK